MLISIEGVEHSIRGEYTDGYWVMWIKAGHSGEDYIMCCRQISISPIEKKDGRGITARPFRSLCFVLQAALVPL